MPGCFRPTGRIDRRYYRFRVQFSLFSAGNLLFLQNISSVFETIRVITVIIANRCLAIPGKILSIDYSMEQTTMAKVDFGGIIKLVCIEGIEVAAVDCILIHARESVSAIAE